ncbi:EAL domain-containing protein [Piscinibacter sp.]|uniref:putative bifunctional diguanylate cyclase/phosphodiesterase n=1 Tax=Piscinibacter sp. TaxID=1903157 RepID=UPI001D6B13E5|nr:EAL domain-containing protein [Piscinibacter sp.]MBK7530988.1 EAL domain-containing protein [Piscinibacter sp.]
MHSTATVPAASPWARLHGALMPDYNRKATAYWWTMVAIGLMTLLHCAGQVAQLPRVALLQVLAGAAIATFAGFFPVRIPRSKNSFAAGEIFIFLVLLLHGPAAASLAAAGEALVGSWRTSRRWTSRIASPAMAVVSMFLAGSLLQMGVDMLRSRGWYNDGLLMTAAMLFSLAYFVLNTLLATLVIHLKRNQPMVLREVVSNFGWVAMAYAGSASVAGLLFLTVGQSGPGVLMAVVPIVGMLLTTLHFFFRQQEADEAMRRGRVEAAEREAAQSALHVQALEVSEQRFHSAFTHASIGMALVSADGQVRQVNRALIGLLGADETAMVGQPLEALFHEGDAETFASLLARVQRREVDAINVELRCRHSDGSDVWVALDGSFFDNPSAEASNLIVQMQDITARRSAEARLQHIAFHDSLTGLPNRSRFHEHMARAIERVQADPQRRFAVMFLDFDRFKLINDSMGHSAGDAFLIQVARRIRDNVRPGDVVARLGGDEFAVLCEDLEREAHAVTLAERLQLVLGEPLQISGTEISTSASIGITFSTIGYQLPEEVLRDADIAMYRAKAAGKARHALFDAGLHQQVTDRVRLEGELRRAVEAGHLSVAYQPLFNLASGKLTGFEALARWQHPVQGLISPAVFIPIAEETALIGPLTDFVLDAACRQLKLWQSRSAAFAGLSIQVNVSGNDIAHSAFAQRVTRAIVAARLQPNHLTLELTENVLMDRVDGAVDTLTRLRDLGVGLSIDDFGTGYSSLSYLSTLPIDSLKIDASFVRGMRNGSKEAEVVRAIVTLGASLGKSVIAEGIETESQFDQLRGMGCESGQGYHLSRPLAVENVELLLDRIETERWTVQHGQAPRPVLHH